MHDLGWMTPAWGRVLVRIFPGPRREKEIRAVYQILRYLHYNNPYTIYFNLCESSSSHYSLGGCLLTLQHALREEPESDALCCRRCNQIILNE
jgi:hypothetical protein